MKILESFRDDAVSVINHVIGVAGFKIEIEERIDAAESSGSEKLQGSPYQTFGIGTTNEDLIIATKGIEGYRLMGRDAEVAADTDLRLVGMMPGAQIVPADADEDAKRASELVNAVMTAMKGSLLDVLRDQMLRESIVTGFSVTEPVKKFIDLPSFGGKIIGLDSLKVRPSENFNDSIRQDEHGNILYFEQTNVGNNVKATPDQVIYYPFRGMPWNPYGRSVYHAAWDDWFLKTNLKRLFSVFCTVNASGIRILTLPKETYKQDRSDATTFLKKLGEYASIVKPDDQDLEFQIPRGDAGNHFISGIRDLCNAEIRKAILYDETINAASEEGAIISSTKAVAQDNVYGSMLAQGNAYAESISEQLFRRILDWNGFYTWPTPLLVPTPVPQRNADPVPILDAIVRAHTAGWLPVMDDDVKQQIVRRAVDQIGVDFEEKAAAPDTDEGEKQKDIQAVHFAAAPPGRQRSDVLKLSREARQAEMEGQADLLKVWNTNLPALKKKLNNALFDPSGQWKSKDYATVRKAVEDNITTGGSKIRKTLTDMDVARYDSGVTDSAKMIPVRAAVSVTPVMISPSAAAKMLNQHVYLTMGKTYQGMTNDLYFILENAINGGISEREAMSQINTYLTEKGIPPGRATTIVNTTLSEAYNQGRMSLFSQLSDPDGTTPGGIIGYEYSAVMDDATTDICTEYNSQFFKVDDPSLPQPPLHYNCRSILIPVFTGEEPWGGGTWASFDKSKEMSTGITTGFGGN